MTIRAALVGCGRIAGRRVVVAIDESADRCASVKHPFTPKSCRLGKPPVGAA